MSGVHQLDSRALPSVNMRRQRNRPGGDDAIRPAFPETPTELAPVATWVYRAHQDLIGLRRRHPWLTSAHTETILLENSRYIYCSRQKDGTVFLEVALTLEGEPHAVICDPHGTVLWQV